MKKREKFVKKVLAQMSIQKHTSQMCMVAKYNSLVIFAMLILKNNLKCHYVSVHERNKQFKCNIYEKGFTQKGGIKIHSVSMHGKDPESDLKIHLRKMKTK